MRRLAHHLDVLLGLEQRPQAGPDDLVIVEEEHPYGSPSHILSILALLLGNQTAGAPRRSPSRQPELALPYALQSIGQACQSGSVS